MGSTQGDPLSTTLFALIMWDALKTARSDKCLILNFADDVYILGRPADALQAFQDTASRLSQYSRRALSVPKCKFYGNGCKDAADVQAAKLGLCIIARTEGLMVTGSC